MSELKKQLFLSELYSPSIGGSCNLFDGRFKHYPPDTVIVLTRKVPAAAGYDEKQAYPIIRKNLPSKGPKGFEWFGVTAALIRHGSILAIKHKIQVIQCARPLPEGVAGWILSKILRKKLVVNFHGEDISVLQQYRVERFLMKRVIRAATLNIANSTYTQSLVRNLGGAKAEVSTVFPGFDPNKFDSVDSKAIPDKVSRRLTGSPVLLTVGRLQDRKGQDQVIRALPQVVKKFPDILYVVIGAPHGGNTELPDILAGLVAELNLSKNVSLLGEISDAHLPYFYAACDIFIMANRKDEGGDVEGFGIVFLEAGCFEKPVIGGKEGGSVDAILDGKTGLLVDGRSVDDIATAIIKLCSDRSTALKMGQEGRIHASNLTHKKMFERYQAEMMARQL